MATELRETNNTLVLHTNATIVERRLKKLKSYIYSIPYYDSYNGKIVGIDLYFDKSARNTLQKLINSSQLPLL